MKLDWAELRLGCSIVGLFVSGLTWISPLGSSVWSFVISGCLAVPAKVLGHGRIKASGWLLLIAGLSIGLLDFQGGRAFDKRAKWARELRQKSEQQDGAANHTLDGARATHEADGQ